MSVVKVKYAEKDNFVLHDWITVKQVYLPKNSFLVLYEAEIHDKDGTSSKMLLRLEYPKTLLRKFKRRYGLSK